MLPESTVRYLISTECVGYGVLVRIQNCLVIERKINE
jgi:hypothetical protein